MILSIAILGQKEVFLKRMPCEIVIPKNDKRGENMQKALIKKVEEFRSQMLQIRTIEDL